MVVAAKGCTMDSKYFDHLIRAFGDASSRRTALRGLAAGAVAATGLGALISDSDAQRRRNRNRRNRRSRCGKQYAGCNSENDCCTGLICKELQNPRSEAEFSGTCAYRRGCGKRNDFCDKNKDCCRNFQCSGKRCRRRNNN
jgi:hypothetical protein